MLTDLDLHLLPCFLFVGYVSSGMMCSSVGRSSNLLKVGFNSRQLENKRALPSTNKPSLARDMATIRRLTSLMCPTAFVLTRETMT